MEELTKGKALEIAVQYLETQISGQLVFLDRPPHTTYCIEKPGNCYWIHVSESQIQHIGAGRIIGISKDTGEVIFDDLVGE